MKKLTWVTNKEMAAFEKMIKNFTEAGDLSSLIELLKTLEEKEHYELCARVSESIRQFTARAV
jgi:hypothetical protein